MLGVYQGVQEELRARPRRWLVTGAAGFIGSNLVETLLGFDQSVVGIDNFATGHRYNLDEVRDAVGDERWARFQFLEGSICDLASCRDAVAGADYVLHQAALGSVPRSIADPLTSNAANVDGFLNILVAARDAGVKRFVYAASSSTYGDQENLPMIESRIGRPLSPYAVTKLVNELYADVFQRCYGFSSIGLRYFNVFGPRQDPNGAYAAVIPKWISAMIAGDTVTIHGDGESTRDFCYVENAIQANLLAALAGQEAQGEVYNVAVGARTSLDKLFTKLRDGLAAFQVHYNRPPVYAPFRAGDLRNSQADISKASHRLGYVPTHDLEKGLRAAMPWYCHFLRRSQLQSRSDT
jgi:UDP-N-acetylglucosamine/UDP-N-acetylgalactosamine 4-epimerase